MHDIDRGASPTAVRLAALAALRNAQGAEKGTKDAAQSRPAWRRTGDEGHPADPVPRGGGAGPDQATPNPEPPAGVYAAVESAVRRSRVEFLSRLLDYRRKLDCEAFLSASPDNLGKSLDEAQFVAHRIAGVGKTLGFADLGDHARQAEAAITAYKIESTPDLRKTAIAQVCALVRLIEITSAEHEDCRA